MSFLDKLTDAASSLTDKAGDVIESTKLKSRISSEKKAIELELAGIGRLYYDKMKNEGFELIPEACEISQRIDSHYETIKETEKTLELYEKESL